MLWCKGLPRDALRGLHRLLESKITTQKNHADNCKGVVLSEVVARGEEGEGEALCGAAGEVRCDATLSLTLSD